MTKSMSRAVTKCTVGLVAAFAAALLSSCTAFEIGSNATSSPSREAGLRGSRLCIVNGTTQTIPMVRERGPFVNGDHHPNPEGPLAPEATWCTAGYNSWTDNGLTKDIGAEILYQSDGSDRVFWAALNSAIAAPVIQWAQIATPDDVDNLGWRIQTFYGWEEDLTYPLGRDTPSHDYHIRRLNDSEYYKEYVVTVRR